MRRCPLCTSPGCLLLLLQACWATAAALAGSETSCPPSTSCWKVGQGRGGARRCGALLSSATSCVPCAALRCPEPAQAALLPHRASAGTRRPLCCRHHRPRVHWAAQVWAGGSKGVLRSKGFVGGARGCSLGWEHLGVWPPPPAAPPAKRALRTLPPPPPRASQVCGMHPCWPTGPAGAGKAPAAGLSEFKQAPCQ